ncbi:MAG: NAD-dependent epimerase/dehydratase family protein [Flavobacteriales bacterium]
MANSKTLIIGSKGQIGTELVESLRKHRGAENVVAADIHEGNEPGYVKLDALDANAVFETCKKHNVGEVYLLAALLSATAEQKPAFAWKLNMESLFNVLELAREKHIQKIYWPSSIAVFGPTTPKFNTEQHTTMEPTTVYGISKLAGEGWCNWYHHKHGVDVRSVRYPGLIGWKSLPGGGTTDYAVDIFHQARKKGKYTSFLKENTMLPMMYMEDAIRASLEIMDAPAESIKIRTSYNLAGMSFTPGQLAKEIKKVLSTFVIEYKPDFRQEIADSWPGSIDDSRAREDWGWKPATNVNKLVEIMLAHIQ